MGGYGSGRWLRIGTKDRASSLISITTRRFATGTRRHMATAGLMEWGRQSLTYEFQENELLLGTIPSLDTIQLAERPFRIGIQQSTCHFGGSRSWFTCPSCQGRVGVVYLKDRSFACRSCCDLAYESQLEEPASRLIAKAHKLRARLGASGRLFAPIPDKPKGMHSRTYWRCFKLLAETEKKAMKAIMAELYQLP